MTDYLLPPPPRENRGNKKDGVCGRDVGSGSGEVTNCRKLRQESGFLQIGIPLDLQEMQGATSHAIVHTA